MTSFDQSGRLMVLVKSEDAGLASFPFFLLLNTTTGLYHKVSLVMDGGDVNMDVDQLPQPLPGLPSIKLFNPDDNLYHLLTLLTQDGEVTLDINQNGTVT